MRRPRPSGFHSFHSVKQNREKLCIPFDVLNLALLWPSVTVDSALEQKLSTVVHVGMEAFS